MTNLKGFYTGCVKSNNIGDDILFFVFLNLLKKTIESKYNSPCELIEIHENIGELKQKWILESNFGVIGGGSLLHPEEISYTIPILNIRDFENNSLVFGTGISDSPNFKIPQKNREKILSYDFSDIGFPMNPLMCKNIEIIKKIKNGGLRGPIDNIIAGLDKESFLYDAGLIAGKYITHEKNKREDNKIGINLCDVSGNNRISKISEDYSSYMSRIKSVISDFCISCLDSGYDVDFYSMSLGEETMHTQLVKSMKLSEDYTKRIRIHNYLDFSKLLTLISGFKFTISLRLHGNILSNSVMTPSINLMYNFKALNYMESTDQRILGIPTNEILTKGKILDKVDYIEKNYKSITENLEKHIKKANVLYSDSLGSVLENLGLSYGSSYVIKYKNMDSLCSVFEIKQKT